MRIRSIHVIATALVLAATIGTQTASAQSESLRSNIPFEFYAAGKRLPAGTYIVAQVNPSTLRLQDARGGKSVFVVVGQDSGPLNDGNWIVFNRYGSRSFLAGAYWSGSPTSLRVPLSREEREVSRIASELPLIRMAAR